MASKKANVRVQPLRAKEHVKASTFWEQWVTRSRPLRPNLIVHEAQTRADHGRGGGGGSGGGGGGDGDEYGGRGREAREEPKDTRWCCVTTC